GQIYVRHILLRQSGTIVVIYQLLRSTWRMVGDLQAHMLFFFMLISQFQMH
ncbi:hypothetical protein HN873_063939, partial [Arachis hypogaea]